MKKLMLAAMSATILAANAQEPADTTEALYGNLDELVVSVKKEIVKSDGATLTYDLDQDDSSKGQTLLDALRKVPMISVDGDDNVYIKGSKEIRVYVNGKEEPMLTANHQKVFKMMPADAVSKIEVITEPGAKYDAEGAGGILNLITERKQSKDGYAGSLSLTGAAQMASASAYGRMKYGNVTADAGIDYGNNALCPQQSILRSHIVDAASVDNYLQKTYLNQNIRFGYLGARMSLSWEPSVKDLFSFGANITNVDARILKLETTNSMYNNTGVLNMRTIQAGSGKVHNLGSNGNFSYRRLLDDNGQAITGAYKFSFGRMDMDLEYENSIDIGSFPLQPYEASRNDNLQREHTATIDYELPFADNEQKLEFGTKGIFRRNGSDTSHKIGNTLSQMTEIEGYNGDIRQIQDVYAGYASYKGTFGNVSATAGVRYEHTNMGLDFIDESLKNFREHLNDVTPNAAVTYMFGPAENIRFAYQMRISRPSVSQLNPAIMQVTQTFAQVGNPDLQSEHINNVSLSYSNFTPTIGGSISASWSLTDNSIEEYHYFENGVDYQTYGNYGHRERTELSAILNWNINSRMSMALNGALNYTDLRSNREGLRNNGWNGRYGANFNYAGPWHTKFTAYGGQDTGSINLQGGNSGWYYYGFSIRKSFLKDDVLSLTLNANNFLTKYTFFKMQTTAGNVTSHQTSANRSWNVGLTLSWNFGQLKDQVKTTNADLDNNDTKAASSSGIGNISN